MYKTLGREKKKEKKFYAFLERLKKRDLAQASRHQVENPLGPSSLLLVAVPLVVVLKPVTTPPTGRAAPILIPRPSLSDSMLRLLAALPRRR